MVRAGASTPSKRKEKDGEGDTAEDKAEEADNKRLRDLSFSRNLLTRTKAHAFQPSLPSNTILNSDGRDIVKKGHRKSKYLFAFPGLMAPVAGGKLGDLTNLDSKNPVLYVEFPQGRLKLFGTIVYPKNKYLTLHFPRGAGNIVCEDCFESIIVFSQAWWIGTKEHNPEEARLPLPKSFEQDTCADVDFTAGAGQSKDLNNTTGRRLEKSEAAAQFSPKPEANVSEAESSGKDTEDQIMSQPVRQSARTAGRKLKYADSFSDEEDDTDSVESGHRGKKHLQQLKEISNKADQNIGECSAATNTMIVVSDCDTPIKMARTGTSERKSPSDVETPTMTDFRNSTVESKISPKASNRKTSLLKQSRIELFCHENPSPKEGHTKTVKGAPLMELEREVTGSHIKSIKRRRKPSKVDSERSPVDDDDDDSTSIKDTPSKDRKRVKCDKGASLEDASTSSVSHSKAGIDGKINQIKSSREKKPATAKASKGVGSASRGRKLATKSTKSSKRFSDTEEEGLDSSDVSDDSDEDWLA